MSKKPIILSVITIVLNGESHLEQTIKSIISQKTSSIEFLIKDGLSTDNTHQIIEQYSQSIDKVIIQKDQGISQAFNQAIASTSGEYILFVNADDWLEDNALELILSKIKESEGQLAQLLIFGTSFWTNNKILNSAFSNPAEIIYGPSIHHSSTVFLKRAFSQYGLFKEDYKLAMDYELLLRFNQEGATYKNYKEIIAHRRLGGVSYINNKSAIKETFKARSNYFNGFELYKWYYYAIVKNNLGRFLRWSHLGFLYQLYWRINNEKIT
ncbi:glycosyltransferase [Saprospiraceae bacterium]|nr:glycosyltransferase [Saprospiraceae bacterium]